MAMGPATADGFYFDFDPAKNKISEADFPRIEALMAKIIKQDLPLRRQLLSVKEARQLFPANPYKQEWLDEIQKRNEKAVIYWTGDQFVDLCSGPHVKSTGQIGAFKLLSIAGAYWHGDEKNKMLTRIYGTCFPTQKELDEYLKNQEEAKKRDHRRLGRELDLFSFHPSAPGDVFWHHKGLLIINELIRYWRQVHQREGYLEVKTPEILTRQTWDQSGHTKFFIDKMYRVLSPGAKKWDMAIKPMNCDGGIFIYKNRPRSYKELPLRIGEIGVVHRYEAPGELHGIIRAREFTQDDAHIYCTTGQVKDELKKVINLCFEAYQVFGLKLDHLELSTKPKNAIGSAKIWQRAESIMKQVLKEKKAPYQINEGKGAFYGPKFDFHLKDSLNRTWQCATIQLDFAQPENFDLEYIDSHGKKQRPVMIHRVVYGSIERFLGILIEHYAGAFPIWLAPVQAMVIPITDKQQKYAEKIRSTLLQHSIKVEIDGRSERVQAKIRDSELQKIPYMLILGPREVKKQTLSVRQRSEKDLGCLALEKFLMRIKKEIEAKQ